MSESARCPECAWSREAASAAADVVVDVVHELEGHLAGEHDWTWQRAHEHARSWSRTVVPALDLSAPPGKAATRTAKCPHCDWSVRAHSEELIEVSRCSSQLEAHLQTTHDVTKADSQALSEEWALPLIRGRVR